MKIESLTTKDLEFYFSDRFYYFGKTQDNGWFLTADGVFKLDLAVSEENKNCKPNLKGCLYNVSRLANKRSKVREFFAAKELAVFEVIYKKGEISPEELNKIGGILHDSIRCRTIYNTRQKQLLDYAKSCGEIEFEG